MYKAPLHIFIVWHPKFKDGARYANLLYSQYTRASSEPLSRGIGIPIFFRSEIYQCNQPIAIKLDEAEHNAIILLVDDKFIIEWKEYVQFLLAQVKTAGKEGNRIFPVSISENFSKAGASLTKNNFIRLHGVKGGFEKKSKFLLFQLTHEFCRMLLDKPRIADKDSRTKLSPEPVSLFISHAKRDGVTIAEKIKKYTDANKPMKTFFDNVDIASGYSFEEELEGNIDKSALLVVQTDSYSSREWCRWEVLKAKKNDKPVVVVNAVQEGEERSFPYLGNVPTIRWKNLGKKQELDWIDQILNFTLYEILRYVYTKKFLNTIKGLASITGTRMPKILSSPPELLTLLEKTVDPTTKGKIVIYPDPPLTAEEMKLLSEISEEYSYVTPTQLLAQKELSD